jgi:hypothetical protein
MKKEFKEAYNYFVKTRKDSALRPVILSYLDKQRAYDEVNFQTDYPYKKYEKNITNTIQLDKFSDIFTNIRKSMISKTSSIDFAFVYNFENSQWHKFDKQYHIKEDDYILFKDNELYVYVKDNDSGLIVEKELADNVKICYSNIDAGAGLTERKFDYASAILRHLFWQEYLPESIVEIPEGSLITPYGDMFIKEAK